MALVANSGANWHGGQIRTPGSQRLPQAGTCTPQLGRRETYTLQLEGMRSRLRLFTGIFSYSNNVWYMHNTAGGGRDGIDENERRM